MFNGYTPVDCKKLYELIDTIEYLEEIEKTNLKNLMYLRVLEVLKVTLIQYAIDSSVIEEILRNFFNSAYNRSTYIKITTFLFDQNIEEAPLKLYDRDLGLYARWRLIIGK